MERLSITLVFGWGVSNEGLGNSQNINVYTSVDYLISGYNKGCAADVRVTTACSSHRYTTVMLLCTQDVAFREQRRTAIGREFMETE